jgi:DNA-binding response OmpR family regulator
MLKVLIAEDELMIADLLEEGLVESGYEVCGIARTVDAAVTLAELHKPDLGVFDIRLAKGGLGPEIVQRLGGAAGFGVLYTTGNAARHSTLTRADGIAWLAKPYHAEDVAHALAIVREVATAGTATPPFPQGFHLLPEAPVRASPVTPA